MHVSVPAMQLDFLHPTYHDSEIPEELHVDVCMLSAFICD